MLNFVISKSWDDSTLSDENKVHILLAPANGGVQVDIKAPFYDDPKPTCPSDHGQSYWKLWDYEVVEAFFLNDEKEYLELEFGPHGHYLVLLLRANGERECFTKHLPLEYAVTRDDATTTWCGRCVIPGDYFPPGVTRFNAYSIHGSDPCRFYQALYPAPHGLHEQPDFHRLEYFREIPSFLSLLPSNNTRSEYWRHK